MRRLLVTGGGTGGHIYPALAVARAFLAGGAGRRVRFVGSRRGLEAQLVPAADVPFSALPIHGWRGKGPLQRLRFLAELGVALLGALGILLRERPGAVFATGSFASLPVLLAARLARRPIFLQEQNSVPGRVIRLFAGRARAVFIAYEEAAQQLPARARTLLTGNPLREEFVGLRRLPRAADAPRRLLVFGGSRGAHSLNAATAEALPLLAREFALEAVLQTGPAEHAAVAAALAPLAPAVTVAAYLDDMPARLAAADWVLCRAGAMTLAELTALGLPGGGGGGRGGVDDHQTANAQALVDAGAAVLIPDAELTGARLAETLAGLWRAPGREAAMAAASRALGRPEATAAILEAIQKSLALCR